MKIVPDTVAKIDLTVSDLMYIAEQLRMVNMLGPRNLHGRLSAAIDEAFKSEKAFEFDPAADPARCKELDSFNEIAVQGGPFGASFITLATWSGDPDRGFTRGVAI